MLISDDRVRAHLRIGIDEDVSVYVGAAESLAAEFMNRNIYANVLEMTAAVLDGTAGESPIVMNDLIQAAVLLITGHLYANREDVVVGAPVAKLPMGTMDLLQPYRKCMGV
ncbi:phage gp6-like head-tail connector protein [Alcaligenaceae bacterium]|nr:phage gp6-like head-tail connector protein [Alcaligenaceae bacterium]